MGLLPFYIEELVFTDYRQFSKFQNSLPADSFGTWRIKVNLSNCIVTNTNIYT